MTQYIPDCSQHPPHKLEHPIRPESDDENDLNDRLKFTAIKKTLKVPFVIYIDFEAFLEPVEATDPLLLKTHAKHSQTQWICLRCSLSRFTVHWSDFKYLGPVVN